jgi:disulfide oxidoreductase YuzD
MSKLKSYHFKLGNSDTGPVWFISQVTAESSKEAVEKLQAAVDRTLRTETADIDYLHVHFNPRAISEQNIVKVNPVDEVVAP